MLRSAKLVAAVGVASALAVTGISGGFASASSPTHTLKFTSVQTSEKDFGNEFVDADKDVQNGKVIGYDVVNGIADTKSETITVDFAASLHGGVLLGHGVGSFKTGKLTGKITGGTGKYKGIVGTVTGQATGPTDDNEKLIIVYH